MSTLHVKVVLLGDSGVGKTSLVNRFVSDTFQQESALTVGATYMSRLLTLGERMVKFNIWDTAGQERYRSLAKNYYRDAEVAVLVYDITKQATFEHLKLWLKELREYGPSNLVIAVVGNKEDLTDEEEVDAHEARSWASEVAAAFNKSSAKTAAGVEALFMKIASTLLDSRTEGPKRETVSLSQELRPRQDSKCC